MPFVDCFQWLLATYAHADEADCEENKATMNMKWRIDKDFRNWQEQLTTQSFMRNSSTHQLRTKTQLMLACT